MRDIESNFQKFVLPNGLTVLLYKMEDVMSTSALILVRNGAVFEKEKERGISHLVEHSVLMGTQKYRSSEIITKTAENLGISYNGGTSKDNTEYPMTAPYMNFSEGLKLLSQFLFVPLLDENQILKEKQVILSEYADFWNDPFRKFDHEVWRKRFSEDEHPYSRRPMGKPETIMGLNQKMVLEWHRKYYSPSNMVLSIAGNFDDAKLKNLIKKLFGTVDSGQPYDEPRFGSNNYSSFIIYHQKDERPQISFSLTFPIFGWREASRIERIKLRLLSLILGSAHSSRLYVRLRKKERLVYNIFCDRKLMSWMGGIIIGGSTPVEKLTKTLNIIKQEIDNLLRNGINEEELNLMKNLSTAKALLEFDNPSDIADYFADEFFYGGEIWFPEKRIETIKKIKVSGLDELARKIFDFSRINIGLLGNVSEEQIKEIKKIFQSAT